jgi:hypothetical protein
MLARFAELELALESVSGLSASADGTRESRERRRSVLLDGDGVWPDDDDVGAFCGATKSGLGLDVGVASVSRAVGSSSETALSAFSSATDDADDCERRELVPGLGAEKDVMVVVETEIEAAWRVIRFAEVDERPGGLDRVGVGLVVAAASASTPSTSPFNTAGLLAFTEDEAAKGAGEVGEILRPNSRFTMRSHLRLSSRSSDSCTAS